MLSNMKVITARLSYIFVTITFVVQVICAFYALSIKNINIVCYYECAKIPEIPDFSDLFTEDTGGKHKSLNFQCRRVRDAP